MTFAAKHRWWLAIVLTLGITICWKVLPPNVVVGHVQILLALLAIAACLPLGWMTTLGLTSSAGLVALALSRVNGVKIALTQSPLTVLDFRIALANPVELWRALNWPAWTLAPAVALAILTVVVFLVAVVWRVALALRATDAPWHRSKMTLGVAVGVAGLAYFMTSVPRLMAAQTATDDTLWEPLGLAVYSRTVGAVPFLLYSYYLESQNTGIYYSGTGSVPPERSEIAEAVRRFVKVDRPPAQLPNIVVLFAESTFDPNRAFALTRPVRSTLFDAQPDTHAVGGLLVNAVGGGSWITEFESLVGIDSRLFGYSGFYTHSALAPFVRKSIVTYLAAKGYDTATYYSWSGDFYNARRAYASYGVRQFFDRRQLRLPDERPTDTGAVASAIEKMRTGTRAPFFGYIVLAENHAPHTCEHFSPTDELRTSFAVASPFPMNCELNEYVRRLGSTEQAFNAVHLYLQEVERTSGRPYVLLTFGDHQPNSFTSTVGHPWSHYDFSQQRTRASSRETFFHIRLSATDVVDCCAGPSPPATLLPTLLSAYVASSVDDLYLPENFYLYARCGSDMLGRSTFYPVGPGQNLSGRLLVPGCEEASGKWLAEIHREGVF